MVISYVIWGVVVGLTVGFTAIGTGILGSPGLILLFGVDPVIAVGTISLAAIPMMGTSLIKHARSGNINWKVGILFAITSIPVAYFTARYADQINQLFEVKNIIASVILISLPLLIYRNHLAAKGKLGADDSFRFLPLVPVAGIILGAVMGATGITGSLTVISFLLIFRMSSRQSVGTTAFVGFFSLLLAGVAHLQSQNYDRSILLSLIPGVIGGSYIGVALINFVPRVVLRFAILGVVAVSGVLIFLQ